MRLSLSLSCVLLASASLLLPALAQAGADAPPRDELAGSEAPLSANRARLLSLALDSVDAFPRELHAKNRAAAQELVVDTCLAIDEPALALEYAEHIDNWRRGLGYAKAATWFAERGEGERARAAIEQAEAVLARPDVANEQQWRRDRVRSHLACAFLALGEPQRAYGFLTDLDPKEYGPAAVMSARMVPSERFDDIVHDQDEILARGEFSTARASLELFVEFHGRFYGDEERRGLCEQRVRDSWIAAKMPADLRIDSLMQLAEHAVEHDDAAHALHLLDEGQTLLEAGAWLPRHRIPLLGRLAAARLDAGDLERARREADNALALFDEALPALTDIWRAETVRPVAEVYARLGDRAKALAVYRRALDEGARNPNSRPRAEDLSETLCSMARLDFAPDEALWTRIEALRAGLGDPW
ncbi:MAG: hypothetical protein H6828_02965 [Planctomycetes bacterium]|nr:hypothetical protein [Planctomycetota bacterium]